MSIQETHDLLERLCNLSRADSRAAGGGNGLPPVQLEALSYLTRCNRYSDNPMAVTEFLGLTKGTVSQTLKVLENKGLLSKQVDSDDRRVIHLRPTAEGYRLIEEMRLSGRLVDGLASLPAPAIGALADALRDLLRVTQRVNHLRTFAPCHGCRFNQREESGFVCGLTGEKLGEEEVHLLCREHQYRDGG